MIGSDESLPIHGKSISSIASRAMTISQSEIDQACEELIVYSVQKSGPVRFFGPWVPNRDRDWSALF